jgi:major vault protein
MQPFIYLKDNEALMLKAERGFIDERYEEVERYVNDEYLYKGPGTYIPRVEESVSKTLTALTILPENGLVIKAKRAL